MIDGHDIPHTPQAAIDAATRRRTVAALERALRALVTQVAREHRHCGKAACRRSGRCRGLACEPECDGDETDRLRLR